MAKSATFVVPPNPTGIYTISVGKGGSGGTSMGDLNRTSPHMIDDGVITNRIVDRTIQGQTIMAEYILPPNYHGMTEAEIKGLLIEKLVHEMYKHKNIEFTRMESVDTDEMVYRARIHVVPDTQVRIIREFKDARKTT
jgi:hypothetical protein